MSDHTKSPLNRWGSTGGRALPAPSGGFTLPAGQNGDRDRRELLARCIAGVYSAVVAAQTAPLIVDDAEQHAVHQMVVACGALAAGESDAFLSLTSLGLDEPSTIHLRSLGENVRRMTLCMEFPSLALQLYMSAEPSWRRVAANLPIKNQPAFGKFEQDMRAIEQSRTFKAARRTVIQKYHLLTDLEFAMWR